MATSIPAKKRHEGLSWTRGTVGWLGLAASPTFALMAWITATEVPHITVCSSMSGASPIGGMAWMYALMSFFHVSPWPKLASRRRTAHPTHDPS